MPGLIMPKIQLIIAILPVLTPPSACRRSFSGGASGYARRGKPWDDRAMTFRENNVLSISYY